MAKPVGVPEPELAAPAAVQPFDYRKFFDFSFFGNLASQFGGNPHGFQPAAPLQPAQNGLISYTVQKQFAPAKHTPVVVEQHQQPQSPVPAVATDDAFGGVEKTVYTSAYAPIVYKKHFVRRHHHHPKHLHVVKTVQIQ